MLPSVSNPFSEWRVIRPETAVGSLLVMSEERGWSFNGKLLQRHQAVDGTNFGGITDLEKDGLSRHFGKVFAHGTFRVNYHSTFCQLR
jgi:hypothetical protein